MNMVRIAEACAIECERQKVGLKELCDLLDGYQYAMDNQKLRPSSSLISTLARMIEPDVNERGYRRVPVTFHDGGTAANHADIPDMMDRLFGALLNGIPKDEASIEAFVKSFLYIHPFLDGNGRTAFVLYNWLRGSLGHPKALPHFYVWS